MIATDITPHDASQEPAGRLKPRGTVWAVLRLHRAALWVWSAFVAVTLFWLVQLTFVGRQIREFCAGSGVWDDCSEYSVPLVPDWDYAGLVELMAFFVGGVPFVVAAYVGGVLIGRDFEMGTIDLVWMQSISPLRWLAVKLGVAALLITAGTAAMAIAFRLMWNSGEHRLLGAWYESAFNAMGPTVLAYSLLGLAVGALVALLTGRAMPALASAFGVTLCIRLLRRRLPFRAVAQGPLGHAGPNAARRPGVPVRRAGRPGPAAGRTALGCNERLARDHRHAPLLALLAHPARRDRSRPRHGSSRGSRRLLGAAEPSAVIAGRPPGPPRPPRRPADGQPPTYAARCSPVRVERAATRSAGVPSKTTWPPSWPAPGPRSMIQSACAMTAW